MPTLQVDDHVYAVLTRGVSDGLSANAALRVVLGLPLGGAPHPVQAAPPVWRVGRLHPLIDACLLQPGQRVIWHRQHLDETHTATITSRGFLMTASGHETVSPGAAAAIAGYPCKGWECWRTDDGTTLDQFRSRCRAERAAAASVHATAAAANAVDTEPFSAEPGNEL